MQTVLFMQSCFWIRVAWPTAAHQSTMFSVWNIDVTNCKGFGSLLGEDIWTCVGVILTRSTEHLTVSKGFSSFHLALPPNPLHTHTRCHHSLHHIVYRTLTPPLQRARNYIFMLTNIKKEVNCPCHLAECHMNCHIEHKCKANPVIRRMCQTPTYHMSVSLQPREMLKNI